LFNVAVILVSLWPTFKVTIVLINSNLFGTLL